MKFSLTHRWIGIELAGLLIAVLLFCGGFLGLRAATQLPGNESEVFQLLDWTLFNSIREYKEFPLWNQYLHAGLPYIADPMLHVYNPVVTLPVLLWGVQAGFKMGILLSFLIAAFGMWGLCKTLGMKAPVRVWVALMYVFAGQPVGRFFQGQYLFVLGFAWLPWIFTFLFQLSKTHRRFYGVLTAFAVALLFFSGNAYYQFYMLLAAGLFGLVTLFRFQRKPPYVQIDKRLFFSYLGTAILTLGLIAVQLLPSAEFWPRVSKDLNVEGSHTLSQIFLDYTSKDPLRADAYRELPAREEFYAYIGYAPFAALGLLPLAVWKRDRRQILFFVLLIVLVVFWISLDYMPWQAWFKQVKILLQFRHLLRILIYGSLAILVLAGLGLDTLWNMLGKQGSLPGVDKPIKSYMMRSGQIILAILLLLGVGDVFTTNQPITRTKPIHQPALDVMARLRQLDPGDYYVRHNPSNAWHEAVIANRLSFLDAWYHFADIRDTSLALNQRPVVAQPHYITQSSNEPAPEGGWWIENIQGYDIYNMLGSLPMAFTIDMRVLKQPYGQGPIQTNDVKAQPFSWTGSGAFVVAADAGEYQYNQDVILVALITHYPGWQVEVDGKKQTLLNVGGYLAVRAQAGAHEYVFKFRPQSFYQGLFISLIALVAAVSLLVSEWAGSPTRKRIRSWVGKLISKVNQIKAQLKGQEWLPGKEAARGVESSWGVATLPGTQDMAGFHIVEALAPGEKAQMMVGAESEDAENFPDAQELAQSHPGVEIVPKIVQLKNAEDGQVHLEILVQLELGTAVTIEVVCLPQSDGSVVEPDRVDLPDRGELRES